MFPLLHEPGPTPHVHLLVRDVAGARVALRADTCTNVDAAAHEEEQRRGRSGTSVAVQTDGHGQFRYVPWMGLVFCSSARSFEASSHSLVMVLGGAGAEAGVRQAKRVQDTGSTYQ